MKIVKENVLKAIDGLKNVACDTFLITSNTIKAIDKATSKVYIGKFASPIDDVTPVVVNKNDFLHILNCGDFDLDADGHYLSADGRYKGLMQINKEAVGSFAGLEDTFNVEGFTEVTIPETALANIKKAAMFADPLNGNASFQMINIKDGKTFSSSGFKIYLNDVDTSIQEILLPPEAFTLIADNPKVKIYKNAGVIILKDDTAEYAVKVNRKADFLPMLEDRMQNGITDIMNGSKIDIKVTDLKNALSFIGYYTSQETNNRMIIKSQDGKVVMESHGADVELVCASVPEGDFVIPVSSEPFETISGMMADDSTVSIYFNSTARTIVITTGNGTEKLVVSKQNI